MLKFFRWMKWRVVVPAATRISPRFGLLTQQVGVRAIWIRFLGYFSRMGYRWQKWRLKRRWSRRGVNIFWHPEVTRQVVQSVAESLGPGQAEELYQHYLREHPQRKVALQRAMFNGLIGLNTEHGLKYGEMLLEVNDTPTFKRVLARRYNNVGYLERPYELLMEYAEVTGDYGMATMLEGKLKLLKEGAPMPELAADAAYEPGDRRVLYLLHNSLPYASAGYATRSHGLMLSIRHAGWDVSGVTRLGFPTDVPKLGVLYADPESEIDGIRYIRMLSDEIGYSRTRSDEYIQHYLDATIELAARERPALLHGASNFPTGIAVTGAARRFGIPSIYEVRGLWEVTRSSRQPDWYESEIFQQMSRIETQACREATRVITITGALKEELIGRGVDGDKITIIPNGVDTRRFTPRPRSEELAEELGMSGKVVIGFVGSLVQYEGLEYLLEAASSLRDAGLEEFAVLIVGGGDEARKLSKLTTDLQLEDYVTFTGRVPHEEVEEYYSVIDIAPFPRKGQLVCEMVSPLKPFEAMAMGKAVVASDVAALAEIVDDGVTGLLHRKDAVDELTSCLRRLILSPELREQLGARAREWVVAERDWRTLGERVAAIYDELIVGQAGTG